MTTAHRPTWKAAVGRANEGGWTAGGAASAQVSTLDAPAHLTLKSRRADGGDKKAALKKSLLALQEAAEKEDVSSGKSSSKKHHHIWKRTMDPAVEERGQQRLLKQSAEVDVLKIKEQYDDADIDDDGGGGESGDESSDLDKKDDDSDLDDDDDDDGSSSSDDDDDEDDEAALQAELAKIRAEREQARLRAEERVAKEENARQEESALLGNPLLATDGGGMAGLGGGIGGKTTKRRWNDDVVFRNQAKGEPSAKKRFINDTVRNDFHKRFLNKFIR